MAWNDLSISQRSQLMNMFRRNGVTSLSEMKRLYDLSSPSTPLAESTDIKYNPVAPVYAGGGQLPPREDEMVGPPVPYGFYDAPINWDNIEARQHYAESRFKKTAKSGKGARGPYQIMPRNWNYYSKKLGLTGSVDDYNNNKAVRDAMMDELYNRSWATKGFPSDSVRTAKTLAAYNWGSGNLTSHLENLKNQGVDIYHSMDWISTLPPETENYVNFILREKDGPGDYTTEAFEKALPHRFDAFPEANPFKYGGIHIKKKNRGKFNALLKRTGKSASWFKAHGTPLQRKRATFAINARKWKHAHGGVIF